MGLNEYEQKEYDEKGIKKKDLVDGAYYQGHCRNARLAIWDANTNQFFYNRTKFGSTFVEGLPGPEDTLDGMDYFLPEKLVENPEETIDPKQDTRGYGFRWDKR